MPTRLDCSEAQVDAVEQGPGELADVLVLRPPFGRALREASGMRRIHGRHEHRVRGKPHRAIGARYGDEAILERFAEGLECHTGKLRQLVEEEHTMVRETHLARARHRASAHDRCGARRVVW